jgi:hypothetical protein
MTILRCCVILVASLQVSACGLYVPAKTLQSETPDYSKSPYTSPEGDYENLIVGHLVCEVQNGIFAAASNFDLPWLKSKKWGTAITLTITAQDQSGVNPGLSFIQPFANKVFSFPTGGNVTSSQSFNLGVGGSASANATRTETIQFTIVNSKLFDLGKYKSPTASDCAPLEHGAMIDGDLKIREFIYDKAVVAYFNNGNPAPVKNPADIAKVPTWPIYNTFTETITFVATLSGNITPSWKLARFSDNTGAGTLLSAQRMYTNTVILTIGPLSTQPSATAPAALSQSAQNQHNAQVQGGATATAIQGQTGSGL